MTTKIALLGDICLNGKFDLKNGLDYREYFKEAAEYLSKFDFVIANLELPLTEKNFSMTCKGLHLKSSLKSVEILSFLNVNVVGLANNHIYDYGQKGFQDTISTLKTNGIDYYGVKNKQVYIEQQGNKIAINGYCCFSSNPSNCSSKGVNPLDPKEVVKSIKSNDEQGYLNLISMHWGDENIHYPRFDHIRTARYLASESSVIIHGHHTHVIQGVEQIDSSLISYSQGNFCTDDVPSTVVRDLIVKQKTVNKESFILTLEVENSKLIKHKTIPIFDTGSKLSLSGDKILSALENYSSALKQDTESYKCFRKEKLDAIVDLNPTKRDVSWYLKRLNYYFIGAVIKGVISQKRYKKVMNFFQEKK